MKSLERNIKPVFRIWPENNEFIPCLQKLNDVHEAKLPED